MSPPAFAQAEAPAAPSAPSADGADLKAILQQLREQARELALQKRMLRDQQHTIESLKGELARYSGQSASPAQPAAAAPQNVAEAAPTPSSSGAAAQTPASEPQQPVGQAPEKVERAPEVPVIASVGGVLAPKGTFIFEPYVQYSRSSINSFTFEGVQIIDAFLIGLINAGQSQDNLVVGGATAYYGLNDRTELEARVPFVYRDDRVAGTVLNQNNTTTIQSASGSGLGDVELAGHYQINDGHDDWPFFIGNLRFKTSSGTGPYDVSYSTSGAALSLPTGSGFPALEPSVTIIYPSDPGVLFGNIGYIHNFGDSVNKTLGGAFIGRVDPGDTYSASFGIGIALNERLSFTLGYEQDYISPTKQQTNGVFQNTQALQIGEALFGISFKVNDRFSVNTNLAIGATRDAPDVLLTVRVPFSWNLCSDNSFFC